MMTEQYPKTEYQEKMRAHLDAMRAQLDELEAQLERTDVKVKVARPQQKIDQTRTIDEKAQDRLHEVEETDDIEWEDLRHKVESAWDDLIGAMKYLAQRVVPDDDASEESDVRA